MSSLPNPGTCAVHSTLAPTYSGNCPSTSSSPSSENFTFFEFSAIVPTYFV